MAHSGIQQQRHPQQNHHCKDCGLYFDSVKSLDVHLHYHKENLLSKWANQLAGGTGNSSSNNNNAGDESNNNSHKTGNNNSKRNIAHDYGGSGIVAAPADSSDSMLKVGPPTPGAVPPGRPSSTSSIVFNRGSPPASSAFTHPPTPSSYSSAPSPYQVESNRFSPAAGGNFNFSNNRTPPSPQNGPANPFSAFSGGTQTYIVDMRSSGDFFNENNSNFILGSGADFPTISSANTVRSSTPSSVSSPSPSSSVGPVTTTTSFRYHPYHHQNNMYTSSDRNGSAVSSSSIAQSSPSHSPQQCEKCGYVCDSSAALTEHLNVAHPPTPSIVSNQQQLFNQHQNMMVNRSAFQQQQQQQQQLQQLLNMRQSLSNQSQQSGGAFNPFGNQNISEGGNRLLHPHQIKSEDGSSFNNRNNGSGIGNQLLNQQTIKTEDEPTAEILDLDSHKVHVYQPPAEEEEEMRDESGGNGNPHSVSAMLWNSNNPSQQQKLFHHHQQQQQQQQQQHQQQQQQLHQQHMGVSPPEFGRGSMSTSSLTPPSSSSEGIIVPQQPMYQHRGYLHLQEQHPNNSSISSVPHQPIISSTHVPNMNPISSSLLPIHNPSQAHQKTTAMSNNIQSQSGASSNQSWKSNEARRPKTYNCSACNKWFTSSGHLKRHYNTTLHKNAVKQSGAPDPATVPITNHHHPSRDPIPGVQRTLPNMGDSSPVISSPVPSLGGEESSRSDDNSHSAGFGRITPQHPHNLNLVPSLVPMPNQLHSSPPNPQAGPSASEIPSGGLLLLSSYNSNNLPDSVHTSQGLLHPQSQHQYTVGVASPPNQAQQHLSQQTLLQQQQQQQQQQLGSHLIHHPIPQQPAMMHQRLQSIPTTNTSMTQTAFPNGLPPHVSITQMPVITNHHLITTTGNQLTSSNTIDDCQDNLVQNHTDLRNGIINMQHLFSSSIPNHHPLPSFAQFHQNHMYGFNGISATQENGYSSVSTTENVGGLSVSPDNQTLLDHHQSFSTSPGNHSNNNNSYSIMNLEEDINNMTSIDGEDRFSPPNHNNNNITNLQGSSDSNGSLGEEMADLSPVGTPDCPTSTNGDFDHDVPKHHIKQEEGTNIISSTNTVTTNGNIYKSSMISNGGIHKCLECDKVFNKACYLTQHNKSFHSGDKPFKCNRCGKRFPAEYLYQEHWGKHAGEKPYKCEICPKQFNHKTDLRRHLCLHTGEKPYACDICGKGFIRKDHMLKHCETHRKKIPQITVQ